MKRLTLLLSIVLLAATLQAQVDITFRVDMSGETVSADGVHVAGDLNGWSTSDNPLTDQGNGIYVTTVSLDPGRDIQYKYLNGNAWGNEEAAPANCTVGGNNRIFTVPTMNDTLDLVPFNGCAQVVAKRRVTFRVDMSAETPSADGVHVVGNFVAWDPSVSMMTDVGDGIYEYETDVLASILTVQYKYVNGNAWGNEEPVPDDCKNGDGNRFEALTKDTVALPIYKFGTCDSVASATSIANQLAPESLKIVMDPVSKTLDLHIERSLGNTTLRVFDLQGRVFARQTVVATETEVDHQFQMTNWAPGIYIIQAETSKGQVSKRFIVR